MTKQICSVMVALAFYLLSPALMAAPNLQVGSVNASSLIAGNSLAEKQIRWVWAHRNDFIKACAMSDCVKQEPLKTLLPRLAKVADATNSKQLQFKSERANPGFFSSNLGESHRIAITGREAGSPIYFNTDLIHDLSLENAVAILFHEWTHHLGLADDAQRLPDQVGALMAKDFTANLLYSPYSGPDNLRLVSAVFQFPTPKETLYEKYFYSNFAFLTDGTAFFDTDLSKFTVYEACDKEGFGLAGQVTQTPHWRDLGHLNGQRELRLTMVMVNACYKKGANGQLADYHYARRGYKFDLQLDQNGMILPASGEFLADALAADIDAASTIEFLSMKYSKTQVQAGDELKISMQVKSYTDLKPKKCVFAISSEGAPLQAGGFPIANETPNCQVKVIGENLWEISTSFKIPTSMVTGNYYPRMFKVVGEGTPNTALLFLPEQNGFSVSNPNSTTALSLQSITVAKDLKATPKFGQQPLTNSYVYQQGQKIELRINVNASSAVRIKGLSTYTMAGINNELQAVQNSGSLEDFTGFNMKQKTVAAGPGLKTIVLTFTIPASWQNSVLLGMSIQGIFLEDESFQQAVWKATGPWDYLFIDKRLMDANK